MGCIIENNDRCVLVYNIVLIEFVKFIVIYLNIVSCLFF